MNPGPWGTRGANRVAKIKADVHLVCCQGTGRTVPAHTSCWIICSLYASEEVHMPTVKGAIMPRDHLIIAESV
jgi:hypothetical protein